MQRNVQPEILDSLPNDAPEAVRSRRDLRLINFFMGNHRWIMRMTSAERDCSEKNGAAVIEIGAGDGTLAVKLASKGLRVTALDLAPAPSDLPHGIQWRQGNFFQTLSNLSGHCLVACLVLHHFEQHKLAELGRLIQASRVRTVVAVEPQRSQLARFQSFFLYPLVNAVTRHDMRVSIEAGFRCGELAEALQFDPEHWSIQESTTILGGVRFHATRRGGA